MRGGAGGGLRNVSPTPCDPPVDPPLTPCTRSTDHFRPKLLSLCNGSQLCVDSATKINRTDLRHGNDELSGELFAIQTRHPQLPIDDAEKVNRSESLFQPPANNVEIYAAEMYAIKLKHERVDDYNATYTNNLGIIVATMIRPNSFDVRQFCRSAK